MSEKIKDRLQAYLKQKGVNNSEFGRRIGASSAYVSSIRKGIPSEVLERIVAEFPDLNIEWLMLGTGEMLRGMQNVQQGNRIGGDNNVNIGQGDTEKFLALLSKKDEQIDRLLTIIEGMQR